KLLPGLPPAQEQACARRADNENAAAIKPIRNRIAIIKLGIGGFSLRMRDLYRFVLNPPKCRLGGSQTANRYCCGARLGVAPIFCKFGACKLGPVDSWCGRA